MQNENGPCPLLAAANVLLLKGSISLPSNFIGAGVVTIDQLVNVLAEKILTNQSASDHHIQEAMQIFPSLQFGMDVNPKFTAGPTGVEYTVGLNAFDLLHIELVHGWLIQPESPEYVLIVDKTYNQLVNVVIEGNDAGTTLQQNPHADNRDELSTKANEGSIIHYFLESSGHQLTQYGLTVLYEHMKDGQMAVFFRNNHFNTLTKHEGHLYLLVTDIGYAAVGNIVWEKLDVINGDTEYVGQDFRRPPPMQHHQVANTATGEQLAANSMQSQADFQLALQLSQETAQPAPAAATTATAQPPPQDPDMEAARQASLLHNQGDNSAIPTPSDGGTTIAVGVPAAPMSAEDRDRMIAMQLQEQEERERSMQRDAQNDDIASRNLAMALHQQEQQRRRPTEAPVTPGVRGNTSKASDCVIS
jgi:hypothetical protein